jgi:hypothetical protein
MAVRWLQQQRSTEAILSALSQRWSISRRQAYRYLLHAQQHLEVRTIPEPKAVFTVNLPRPLIRAVRARCRRQGRPISHVVAEVLQRWLEQASAHG